MPQYIMLWNWTDQGIRNVKDSPKRVEAYKQTVEKNKGRLLSFFYTIGQYDGAAILEAPDDEALMRIALGLGNSGNVRTTTLKALTSAEGAKVISQL